ncbi:MAG: S8 family serine peptidase [Rickettsiales bacterium]
MSRAFRPSSLLSTIFILSVTVSHGAFAAPANLSVPNDLSGATAVMAGANYGSGIVFGGIDTGITPQWIGFTSAYNGQGVSNIDTVNSGVCLNGTCTSGGALTDLNGHGTFTASQIVGGVQNDSVNFSGVARAGKLISVQVLNAQGAGTSVDIANGIRYAVDHGAQVLNLSLGPSGTSVSQRDFYNSIASAVNYAASKNAYVVFAGGNSKQNLAGGLKITGYTDDAIKRLIFVGSTNQGDGVNASTAKISSFSNKPGSGTFQSATGKTTANKNIWVMANGGDIKSTFFQTTVTNGIWGAYNSNSGPCEGYSCVVQNVGTSMAAPQVTGAIGLLIYQWPVLISNGKAAQVLQQTATDLGNKGIDTTYGNGFINLVKAFQPVGGTYGLASGGAPVAITQAADNGEAVSVSQTSGGRSILSGGAMGSLPSVRSVLSNYTVFDSFERDFVVDLSGLVSARTRTSPLSQGLAAPKITQTNVSFADGSHLTFGSEEKTDDRLDISRPASLSSMSNFLFSVTNEYGSTLALGNGFPGSTAFAGALWGSDSVASGQVYSLGVSDALQNLAQGGHFAAYGTELLPDTRMAFSWSQTNNDSVMGGVVDWSLPNASAFGAGVTHDLTSYFTAGVTVNVLDESSGMLGTTYSSTSPVNFGENNRSVSFGVSSAVKLGAGRDLLLDAAIARTDGAQLSGGLISDVTPVYARTIGAALVQRDTVKPGDSLSLSVRAPLRVTSGSAAVAVSSVDENGVASTTNQRASLRPTGSELGFTLGYQAPVNDKVSVNFNLNSRRDADNIKGADDNGFLVGTKIAF